jgi:hypothetical protein
MDHVVVLLYARHIIDEHMSYNDNFFLYSFCVCANSEEGSIGPTSIITHLCIICLLILGERDNGESAGVAALSNSLPINTTPQTPTDLRLSLDFTDYGARPWRNERSKKQQAIY